MEEGSNTTWVGANGSASNHTDTSSDDGVYRKFIFLAIVTIPGVICNTVALFFIIRDVKKAVFPAIILLLALCCADLVAISISAIRHLLTHVVPNMPFSLCAALAMMTSFFHIYAGILNAMMASDRVMAIGIPFYYKRKIDVRRWKVGISVSAAATFIFILLPVMGLGDITMVAENVERQTVICTSFRYRAAPHQQVYGYLYFLVGFLITLTIVVGNLTVIRFTLTLRNKIVNVSVPETSISAGSDDTSASNNASFEVAFAKLMGCLAAVYLVTGTPFYTLVLLDQLNKPTDVAVKSVVHLLAGLSYTIDPIVYILIRKINRKRIINFLFRCHKNEAA